MFRLERAENKPVLNDPDKRTSQSGRKHFFIRLLKNEKQLLNLEALLR